MRKRTVVFGTYDTALYGWTLTGCKLTDPEQKTNYVDKPNGDGSWDLSTAMTDGIPRYKDRKLTVTLECSEGTRDDREDLISGMVNRLDGLEWHIILPDKPNHYLVGRVHVAVNYSDLAHAAVTVTALCQPWFFRRMETVVTVKPEGLTQKVVTLINSGRKPVVPQITVTGTDAVIVFIYGDLTTSAEEGVHYWPALVLQPGATELKCVGRSFAEGVEVSVMISYREAVLR